MSKGKILVTGGAGYIGSHTVVELVKNDYDVVIVDNLCRSSLKVVNSIRSLVDKNRISFYYCDCVNEPKKLESIFTNELDITGVIHFAAFKCVGESVNEPLMYYHNNLASLLNILMLMSKYNINNLIFSSSCTVYGEPDQSLMPITEELADGFAKSPYGETKVMCEKIIKDTVMASNIKAILLRYFNPIGAHPSIMLGESPISKPNNLLPFVTKTAIGDFDKLTIFGNDYNTNDGTCLRDYIDIVDLADAHVKALDYIDNVDRLDVFNLGTGEPLSVLEIVNKFEQVNNVKVNYDFGPRRDGDVTAIWADCKKANEKLNWYATTPIEETLRNAWEWEKKIHEKRNG